MAKTPPTIAEEAEELSTLGSLVRTAEVGEKAEQKRKLKKRLKTWEKGFRKTYQEEGELADPPELPQAGAEGDPLPNLPGLPPTLAHPDFITPDVQLELRKLQAEPLDVGEREKVLALAKRYYGGTTFRSEGSDDWWWPVGGAEEVASIGLQDFRDKIDTAYKEGKLTPKARERVEIIYGMKEELKDISQEDLSNITSMSDLISALQVKEHRIGPRGGMRVDLTRDPQTGLPAIDVFTTFGKLTQAYSLEAWAEQGYTYTSPPPPEIAEEIFRAARNQAGRDIIGAGRHGRRAIYYDINAPKIERLSSGRFGGTLPEGTFDPVSHMERTLRAHWEARQYDFTEGEPFGIFTPRLEELQKEGTMSWLIRQGPLDYMAPKLKLMREKLTQDGKTMAGADAAAYIWAAIQSPVWWATANQTQVIGGIPIGYEELGITPEEEVQAYMEGWTWLDEGRMAQGEVSAILSKLTGGSVEEQKQARQETASSGWSMVAPFVYYFADPDMLTLGTIGTGKAIGTAFKFRRLYKMTKFAKAVEAGANQPDVDFVVSLQRLRKIDPGYANTYEATILSALGDVGEGPGKVQQLEAKLAENAANYERAVEEIRVLTPGIDLDNIKALSKAAREDPVLKQKLFDAFQYKSHEYAINQVMARALSRGAEEIGGVIATQEKTVNTGTKAAEEVKDLEARLVHALHVDHKGYFKQWVDLDARIRRWESHLKGQQPPFIFEGKIIGPEYLAQVEKDPKFFTQAEKEMLTEQVRTKMNLPPGPLTGGEVFSTPLKVKGSVIAGLKVGDVLDVKALGAVAHRAWTKEETAKFTEELMKAAAKYSKRRRAALASWKKGKNLHGDLAELEKQIKHARKVRNIVAKSVEPATRKAYRDLLKQTKRAGREAKTAHEATIPAQVTQRLRDKQQSLRGQAHLFAQQFGDATKELRLAALRHFSASPKAAKKTKIPKKARRAKKLGPPSRQADFIEEIFKGERAKINKYAKSLDALLQSERAATWRKHATVFAGELRQGADRMRRAGGNRGWLFTNTGILGLQDETAKVSKILSDAISEVPMTEIRGITASETIGKKGIGFTVSIDSPNGVSVTGNIAEGTGKILEMTSAHIPDAMKGTAEEVSVLREMLDYAKRNNLTLKISEDVAVGFLERLQNAGVPFKGKTVEVAAEVEGAQAKKTKVYSLSKEMLEEINVDDIVEGLRIQGKSVQINPIGLKEKLVTRVGQEAIDATIRRMGTEGKLLDDILKSPGPVKITPHQMERLTDDIAQVLAYQSHMMKPENQALHLAVVMHEASRGVWASKEGLSGTVGRFVQFVAGQFDPWRARIGLSSEQLSDVVRSQENLFDIAWDEYVSLLSIMGRNNKQMVQNTHRFLDSTQRFRLKGRDRTTMLNVGPKTHFQRAQRYAKTDPRSAQKYTHNKDLAAAAAVNNPTLLGFSRMWLPSWVQVSEQQAGQLYKAARSIFLNSASYTEATQKMAGATSKIIKQGELPGAEAGQKILLIDNRMSRVHGMGAKAVIWGSSMDRAGNIARKATGGILDPSEVKNVNHLFSGEYHKITDMDSTLRTLRGLGLPLTESSVKVVRQGPGAGFFGEVFNDTKRLVALASDESGKSVFATNVMRTQLQKSVNGAIKSLDAHTAADPTKGPKRLVNGLRKYALLWKTEATSGLGVPNLGHMHFNQVQDSTQIFFEGYGLRAAGEIYFQNVWPTIPFVGRAIQDWASRLSKAAGGKPVLRSVASTLYNPHIDDFWQGRPGVIRIGKNGPLKSYDHLREKFIREGIFDVMLNEDILKQVQKIQETSPIYRKIASTPEMAKRYGKAWQDKVNQFVLAWQQRQRVGTALYFINKGHGVDEAIRMTRTAIYDWKHGISHAELFQAFNGLPFYRWFRLASKQWNSMILDPLTKPGEAIKALTGRSKLRKIEQGYRFQRDVLPVLLDSRSLEEIAEEESYLEAHARVFYPKWMRERYPMAGIMPADLGDIQRFRGDEREITHWAGVLPTNAMVDVTKIMMAGPMTAMATYLAIKGEDEAAHDLLVRSSEELTGLLWPTFRDMAEDAIGTGYRATNKPGSMVSYTEFEADVLGGIGFPIHRESSAGGRAYGPATPKIILNMTPGLMHTIPRLVNAAKYRNPAYREDILKMAGYFIANYTRYIRWYPYNVHAERKREQMKIAERINQLDKRSELYKDTE